MKLYRGELLQSHLIDISMADVAPCIPRIPINLPNTYTRQAARDTSFNSNTPITPDTPYTPSTPYTQQNISPILNDRNEPTVQRIAEFSNCKKELLDNEGNRARSKIRGSTSFELNKNQGKSMKLPFESMSLVTPSPPSSPCTPMADAIDVLTIMSDGCLFLTICHKPHFQLMFLSEDNQRLQWYTHLGGELDKLHSLLLEDIVDVKCLDVIVLIKHKKGLLKLGATNSEDLHYWYVGLTTLMQPDFRGTEVLVAPPAEKKSFIPRLTELYGKMSCPTCETKTKKKDDDTSNVKKQRRQRQNPVRKATTLFSTILPYVTPKASRPQSSPPVQDVNMPRPKVPRRPASSFPKPPNSSALQVAMPCPNSRQEKLPPNSREKELPLPHTLKEKLPPPNTRPSACIPRGSKTMWVRKGS